MIKQNLSEDDKYYFTLIDFRKATNHFADPDFDGEPVQIYEPGESDPVMPPELLDDMPLGAEDAPPDTPADDETVVVGYQSTRCDHSARTA